MVGCVVRRRLCTLVLAVLIMLGGPSAPQAVAPAHAADAALVLEALKILTEKHVDAPDPIKLLAAALNGLRQALVQAGISESLPDLPTDGEASARGALQARLNQASTMAQGKMGETQLQFAAVQAMVASLGDRRTYFLTPEQMAERARRDRGEVGLVGIGIILIQREGRFYVLRVLPQSPAARAGIRDLDRVLAVDGNRTDSIALDELSRRIRGPEGTTIALVVQRPGQADPLSLQITRETITASGIEQTLLDDGIGRIRFLGWPVGSAGQVRRATEEMQRQTLRGLVLDLRGNVGTGRLSELMAVAEIVLPAGLPIYRWQTRQGRGTATTQGSPLVDRAIPFAILVDGGTGGLSVLFAAAVQEHRRGKVVGARTRVGGPGSDLIALPGGAGIQVTTARISTGAGWDLETRGLEPDIVVDLSVEDLDRGVDTQLQHAVQIIKQAGR